MRGPRWLASPLAATAGVLAGLSLLAIPLRKLTAPQSAPAMTAAPAAARTGLTPAVLRLRLLAPARRVACTTATGKLLLDLRDVAAGESEHDALLPLDEGGLDLTMQADFGDNGSETAVFLTVMPEGYEDQTRYALGTGRLAEALRYAWRPH